MADVKTVRFLENIYGRIDRQVREILAASIPPVSFAAQDDGDVITNVRRILNFQGAGVQVTDNPALKRADIFIPGTSTANVTTRISSSILAKKLSLWNGSSNDAPPSNWETTGFSDAGWGNAVVATIDPGQAVFVPSGASAIWSTATATVTATPGESVLFRQSFAIPSGAIASASITITWDAWGDVYINGTLVGQDTEVTHSGPQLIIPIEAYLIPGATNVIAVRGNDDGGVGANRAWTAYQLAYSQNTTVAIFQQVLTADVSMTTLNTFYDGPSIVLPAGSWLISGAVTCFNSAFATDFVAKLWDGTTVLRSGENNSRAANVSVSVHLSAVVTITASTTYKISATASNNTSLIKAATAQNASGNTASYLNAIPA